MQLLTRITNAVNQVRLHETVDIFIFIGDRKHSAFHIQKNAVKPVYDLCLLLLSQYPLLRQHRYMRDTATDILRIEALIKGDGGIKIVN